MFPSATLFLSPFFCVRVLLTRFLFALLSLFPSFDQSENMKYIISGVTNGGKTLTNRLTQNLPNCCMVHHNVFFKPRGQTEVGDDGFKQYNVITALDMEAMMSRIYTWLENPVKSHGVNNTLDTEIVPRPTTRRRRRLISSLWKVYWFTLTGLLIDMLNQCYFISIPYEECKKRKCSRK